MFLCHLPPQRMRRFGFSCIPFGQFLVRCNLQEQPPERGQQAIKMKGTLTRRNPPPFPPSTNPREMGTRLQAGPASLLSLFSPPRVRSRTLVKVTHPVLHQLSVVVSSLLHPAPQPSACVLCLSYLVLPFSGWRVRAPGLTYPCWSWRHNQASGVRCVLQMGNLSKKRDSPHESPP